jgi:hypothetical protein
MVSASEEIAAAVVQNLECLLLIVLDVNGEYTKYVFTSLSVSHDYELRGTKH